MRDNYIIIAGKLIIGGRICGKFVRGATTGNYMDLVILANGYKRLLERRMKQ